MLTALPVRADSQADAAAAFDAGVSAYQAGDFAGAAARFFAADRAQPNPTALANALSAAERAAAWPLAANIASTIQARSGMPAELLAKSHEVMAQAAPHAAQLTLSCDEGECALLLDGQPASSGVVYVAPGEHRVGRQNVSGGELTVSCAGGARCPVAVPTIPVEFSVPVSSAEDPRGPEAQVDSVEGGFRKHLPLSVFVGSSAAAVTFIALTTWQGVAAMNAKDLYTTNPDEYRSDKVHDNARRADIFLGASILFTGAAVATGIWWVDWKSYRTTSTTNVAPLRGGALLMHRVQF